MSESDLKCFLLWLWFKRSSFLFSICEKIFLVIANFLLKKQKTNMLFDIFYRKTENNLTRESVVFTRFLICFYCNIFFFLCVCVEKFLWPFFLQKWVWLDFTRNKFSLSPQGFRTTLLSSTFNLHIDIFNIFNMLHFKWDQITELVCFFRSFK